MTPIHIGIDNAIRGAAFAIIGGGKPPVWCVFREMKLSKESRSPINVVDPTHLQRFIDGIKEAHPGREIMALIEAPALNKGRATTAASIASTAASFGILMNVLVASGVRATAVPAVTWQKYFWKSKSAVDSKPSIALAQKLFNMDFVPAGCRVPHDGATDAALMAVASSDPCLRTKILEDMDRNAAKRKKARAEKAKAADGVPPDDADLPKHKTSPGKVKSTSGTSTPPGGSNQSRRDATLPHYSPGDIVEATKFIKRNDRKSHLMPGDRAEVTTAHDGTNYQIIAIKPLDNRKNGSLPMSDLVVTEQLPIRRIRS